MKKNTKAISGIIGIMLVIIIAGILTYNYSAEVVHPTPYPKLGDTRIQQYIHFKTPPMQPDSNRRYYIHTYIEVYNGKWEQAESWHNYATADQVVHVKAWQRKFAKEAGVKIGKAIREFHYGKESE